MSWDDADKQAKDTGGKFIKMQDDEDSCKGVLMGKPTVEETFFDQKAGKTRPFTEDDAKAGEKPTPKFKFNLFTLEVNDDKVEKPDMRILTVNATTYRFISKQRQKRSGDLGWYPISIIRSGKKGDTNTTYNVSVSDKELSESLQKVAKAMKVHNLEDDESPSDSDSGGGGFDSYDNSKTEDDGPISKEQKTQLSGPYRKGEKLADELQGFLAKFGIQKFTELKASQFDEAMAHTRSLLTEGDDAGSAEEEDPFA